MLPPLLFLPLFSSFRLLIIHSLTSSSLIDGKELNQSWLRSSLNFSLYKYTCRVLSCCCVVHVLCQDHLVRKQKHSSLRSCQEEKAWLSTDPVHTSWEGRVSPRLEPAALLGTWSLPACRARISSFVLITAPCLAVTVLSNGTPVPWEGPQSYPGSLFQEPVDNLLYLPKGRFDSG